MNEKTINVVLNVSFLRDLNLSLTKGKSKVLEPQLKDFLYFATTIFVKSYSIFE